MLRLTDIQDWIISLGIAEESHVYIGKLDNKQQKSIFFKCKNKECRKIFELKI